MARLNVSPTRMVLSTLKGRLETASRGYKLLKDKQDELMRQFIDLVRQNMNLRQQLEADLQASFRDFMLAGAVMSPEMLELAVSFPDRRLGVEIKVANKMSVRVPELTVVEAPLLGQADATAPTLEIATEAGEVGPLAAPTDAGSVGREGDRQPVLPYGYLQTSADLDAAIDRLRQLFDRLMELAQIEKTCQLLADDIESTRRRVNALEYRTIPDLKETIRYIRMKLEENERATITRLMKVKQMIAKDDDL